MHTVLFAVHIGHVLRYLAANRSDALTRSVLEAVVVGERVHARSNRNRERASPQGVRLVYLFIKVAVCRLDARSPAAWLYLQQRFEVGNRACYGMLRKL